MRIAHQFPDLDPATRSHVLHLYGSLAEEMLEPALLEPSLLEPIHPDAPDVVLAQYAQRLAASPTNVPALAGAAFAHWWYFDYPHAIQLLNGYIALRPDDAFGYLFSGSSRLLLGTTPACGEEDLEIAIGLAPSSPHVRFIVADAYTYGEPDPLRAFEEASLALGGGLETPRVLAILGACYNAFGDSETAASYIDRHISMVTTETLTTGPLTVGKSMDLEFVPGRTYEIPIPAAAGEALSISTFSHDFFDSILVLLAPDGTPALGSDDSRNYFAGIDATAGQTGTYRLLLTTFEGVSTGEMRVARR
jgi:hypothetical protein